MKKMIPSSKCRGFCFLTPVEMIIIPKEIVNAVLFVTFATANFCPLRATDAWLIRNIPFKQVNGMYVQEVMIKIQVQ
jgi:hypothetical protein